MDSILEILYCGTLKMWVSCEGNFGPDPTIYTYTVRSCLGAAPLHVDRVMEVPLCDMNPIGKEALILVCNKFIDALHDTASQNETTPVQMDSAVFKTQLFNILCQNVEGILQPDQPKWLITDREI